MDMIAKLVFASVAALSACGRPAASDLAATHQRTGDVSVLSAQRGWSLCFRYAGTSADCSGYTVIHPQLECRETGKEQVTGGTTYRYDCTEAVARVIDVPVVNAVTATGWRSTGASEISFDPFYFGARVRVAVRGGALDAASFSGIGFWANRVGYSMSNPTPPPPGAEDIGQFTRRADLDLGEAVTFKDGAPGRVATFAAFFPMSHGGSSYIHGLYLRPNARFVAGGEEYYNWDAVAGDYFINWRTYFDRSADVLR